MKKLFTCFLLLIFSISYADDIKIITKEIKDSSASLRYHVSAKYPQLDGMKNQKIQDNINLQIYKIVLDDINNFTSDMKDWDLTNVPKDFNSEIDHSFTSYTLTNEVFSFSFEIYAYYAGAAHPNHWSESMNFDLINGKLISFKDLFKTDSKFLEKISLFCKKDLQLQAEINDYSFDEVMLNDGAGAKLTNFKNFNILQKGIQITFDPYQVAPYVVGTQYVIIPYSALYEFISEDSILSKFVY